MCGTVNASDSWPDTAKSPPAAQGMMHIPFPGIFNLAMNHFLAGNSNGYASFMLIFGSIAVLRTYIYQFRTWFNEYFTKTVHVKHSDEAYDMLLHWISARGFDNAARSTIARVGAKWTLPETHFKSVKKQVCFAPWNGTFLFWFQQCPLYYRTETVNAGLHREEVVSITCLGRSGRVIKELFEECRRDYLRRNQNKTTIFKHRGNYWKKATTKDTRPLSTVIVPEQQKQLLVDDIQRFLDTDTQNWYSEHKIPYRRGYLLFGPPGTGKSSLSSAIAGRFGLDIYIVNIPSVNDQILVELFNELPERCIVLLEDIDAVGTDRSQEKEDDGEKRKRPSLSGLLNTLDGVASQEGRVLIMTTNHIELLDQALTRPGRIDFKVKLDFADSETTAKLFEFIYKPVGEASSRPNNHASAMRGLARAFAAKVPEQEFTVAQIMSYLIQHKDSPVGALEHTDDWIALVRDEMGGKDRRVHNDGLQDSEASYSSEELAKPREEGLWMESGTTSLNGVQLRRTKNYRNLRAVGQHSPCNKGLYDHGPLAVLSPYMTCASPHRCDCCTKGFGKEDSTGNLDLGDKCPYTADESCDRQFQTPLKPAARQSQMHALPRNTLDKNSDASYPESVGDRKSSLYGEAVPEILTARAVVVQRRPFSPTFGEWTVLGPGNSDAEIKGKVQKLRPWPGSALSGLRERSQANGDAPVAEVSGTEGFGYSFASTDPKTPANGELDDSCSDISDTSCGSVLLVPLKTVVPESETDASSLPMNPSCVAPHESSLGVISLPPKPFAPAELSENPAPGEWEFISSDYRNEKTEGKVREWYGCSDTMLGGVIEPWPSPGDKDGDGEVATL